MILARVIAHFLPSPTRSNQTNEIWHDIFCHFKPRMNLFLMVRLSESAVRAAPHNDKRSRDQGPLRARPLCEQLAFLIHPQEAYPVTLGCRITSATETTSRPTSEQGRSAPSVSVNCDLGGTARVPTGPPPPKKTKIQFHLRVKAANLKRVANFLPIKDVPVWWEGLFTTKVKILDTRFENKPPASRFQT